MMDKNKYKTLSIALEKEVLQELNDYCKDRTLKSIFVRNLIKKELAKRNCHKRDCQNSHMQNMKNMQTGEGSRVKIIKVKVDNYDEIASYVKAKKFGTISSFCTYSMATAMVRHPLKKDDKK